MLAPVGAVYGLVLMDWLRSLLNWLGSLFSRGSRDDEGWIEPSNVITRAILAMDELPPVMEPVVAEDVAPEPEPTPEPVVEPAAAEVAAPRKKSDETEEEAEEQAAEPAAEERAA